MDVNVRSSSIFTLGYVRYAGYYSYEDQIFLVPNFSYAKEEAREECNSSAISRCGRYRIQSFR